jgi:hypothetical protein
VALAAGVATVAPPATVVGGGKGVAWTVAVGWGVGEAAGAGECSRKYQAATVVTAIPPRPATINGTREGVALVADGRAETFRGGLVGGRGAAVCGR